MLLRINDYAQTNPEMQAFVNNEFALLNQTNAEFLGSGDNVTINPGYTDQSN